MEKRKKTKQEMMEMQLQANNFFKKTKITSISDILNIYLFFDLTQELVNVIVHQSGAFLYNAKGIDAMLIEQNFNLFFQPDKDQVLIQVSGNNLLSSLWLIGVYPEHPEQLVDKLVYKNGDFIYRFYTKNKNLSITKPKHYEAKPTDYP